MRLTLTTATALGLLVAPARAEDAPSAPRGEHSRIALREPSSSETASLETAPPETAPPAAPDRAALPQPPDRTPLRHPFFVHESFGVNVVTYTQASGKTPSSTVTPGDKAIVFQQIGVGYWVHPNIRLQLTGIFGETLSGLKPGASSFTLGGVIPCVFYTNHGLFGGLGPLFAPRAFGKDNFNVGLFSVAGYALPLGGGVSLAAAVQVPVMFEQMVSVAVTPAAILGERF
jgi:hypothetical protein